MTKYHRPNPFVLGVACVVLGVTFDRMFLQIPPMMVPPSSWGQDEIPSSNNLRRLSSLDPKTVEPRASGPILPYMINPRLAGLSPRNADSDSAMMCPCPGNQFPQQFIGPSTNTRLITASPAEMTNFPFFTSTEVYQGAKSRCVPAQDILNIRNVIKDLYHNHNIRIFPRNGFLLGIVRHGGLLPIEQIDFDLGVVYEDLLSLIDDPTGDVNRQKAKDFGDFQVKLTSSEPFWVNWKGRNPATGEQYPYFGAKIRRNGQRLHAYAAYQYRDTGKYFYPRLDKADFNHKSHVKEALKYNLEGGGYVVLDTDEPINEKNYQDGSQVGSLFNTDFSCFTEVQFYFTTIYVPCDYDAILTSQYGKNWRYVEKRAGGGGHHVSAKVSVEENEKILNQGPFPVCAGVWETLKDTVAHV